MLDVLPRLNAALNATSCVLLILGWRAIRAGDRELHKKRMVAALAVSILFLVSYGIYHALGGFTPFEGTGALRTAYFAILVPHSILAAILAVFPVPRLVYLAFKGRFEAHRTWGRWVFPVWIFVSLTGVLVYVFLYHLNPGTG